MKTTILLMLATAALAVGCDEKKSSEGATPSATVAASAAPSTAPPATVSAASTASAAPSATTPVPTPEQYEKKAAAIQPTAAEVEMSKIEKELGP